MPAKSRDSAVDRLKRRIAAKIDSDRDRPRDVRLSQKGLADRLGVTKGTLSEMLSGPSAQRGLLAHLDNISDYLGLPVAELVAPYNSRLAELRPEEQRLLAVWRSWPSDVRSRLLSVLEFFGELSPDQIEQRNWLHDLRRINDGQRAALRKTLDVMLKERAASRRGRSAPPDPRATDAGSVPGVPTPRR